jgi:excisionase family DNA binding protein
MSPKEVSSMLRIALPTVYYYLRKGDIPSTRLGKLYRVNRADVLAFMESNRTAGRD